MGTNADLPEAILTDRKAFFSFLDFDTLGDRLEHFFAQFSSQLALCDEMLAESPGAYLAGAQPGWADLQAYFPLWMARGNIATTEALLAPFATLRDWEQRMNLIGCGTSLAMDAQHALELARQSESVVTECIGNDSLTGCFALGDDVSVTPDDYGQDPVHGQLVLLTGQEIAVRRNDAQAGDVVVHFPRAGFELRNRSC